MDKGLTNALWAAAYARELVRRWNAFEDAITKTQESK